MSTRPAAILGDARHEPGAGLTANLHHCQVPSNDLIKTPGFQAEQNARQAKAGTQSVGMQPEATTWIDCLWMMRWLCSLCCQPMPATLMTCPCSMPPCCQAPETMKMHRL